MKRIIYFCLAGWLLLPMVSASQSGSLDLSFGSNGKRIESMGVAGFDLVALQQLPDGTLLTGGSSHFAGTGFDIVLHRFLADGSTDNTFGINGKAVTPLPADEEMQALVLLPSGKILVGASGSQNLLLRYNSNGSLDNTFNGSGVLLLSESYNFELQDLCVQPDGKILILGDGGGYPSKWIVLRLTENGTPDAGFDGDGEVILSIEDSWLTAASMDLQPDGKLVLAGMLYDAVYDSKQALLWRLLPNGASDNSFGSSGNGQVTASAGEFDETITEVMLQPDGKILAGGYGIKSDGSFGYTLLLRFTTTGSKDVGLWGTGTRIISTASAGFFSLGRLLYDGDKIVLAGVQQNTLGMYSFAFLRLTDYGHYDAGFGVNGIAATAPAAHSQLAVVSARQSDGQYLAGGYLSDGKLYKTGLVRMRSTGQPDDGFGTNALVSFVMSNADTYDRATTVLVNPDNSFFVAGEYANGLGTYGFVRKYLSNGTPDAAFGTDGRVNLPASFMATLSSVITLPGGKLLLLGTYVDIINGQDLVLYRLEANGAPDNSFGTGGRLVVANAGVADYGFTMGVQSSGKIIVLALRANDASEVAYLYRFTPDGVLDAGFGTAGQLQLTGINIELNDYAGYNQRLLILPDDRIVITGILEGSATDDICVLRFTPDGATDPTFNSGNPVHTNLGNEEAGIAVALQPDGKLVVAGRSTDYSSNEQRTVVLRYNSDGTPDNSFDGDGIVWMPGISVNKGYPAALRVLSNGQLLAAGTIVSPSYTSIMVVARLNADGSFDPEFGTSGIATVMPTGNDRDITFDMQLQSDGKILLAGQVTQNYQEDMVVVRLNQTIPTGLIDRSLPLAALEVAPNPIRNQVTLRANTLESGAYQLRIFTADGRLVDSRMFTVNAGSLNYTLDASAWPNGLLLLTITGRNSQKTFRVVKQ